MRTSSRAESLSPPLLFQGRGLPKNECSTPPKEMGNWCSSVEFITAYSEVEIRGIEGAAAVSGLEALKEDDIRRRKIDDRNHRGSINVQIEAEGQNVRVKCARELK